MSEITHFSFTGHAYNVVTCLLVDNNRIISASDDHSIDLYDIHSGERLHRFEGHETGVWSMAKDGRVLVTGSTDRTVRLWDLVTYKPLLVLRGHQNTVRSLQVVNANELFGNGPESRGIEGESEEALWIVSGSRDATVRVWKVTMVDGEIDVARAAYTDGTGEEGKETGCLLHTLRGHTAAVREIAVHQRTCISGSYDSTVRVWDIVSGECKYVLSGHEAKVYSVALDHRRHRALSGSMDNSVKVWDLSSGQCLHTFRDHTSLVGLLAVSSKYIVSAAADAMICVYDSDTLGLLHNIQPQGGAITCFKHDDERMVAGCDGSLKMWDIRSGKLVRDLLEGVEATSSVWQVAMQGDLVVAASKRKASNVFDIFRFPAQQTDGRDVNKQDA